MPPSAPIASSRDKMVLSPCTTEAVNSLADLLGKGEAPFAFFLMRSSCCQKKVWTWGRKFKLRADLRTKRCLALRGEF